MCEYGKKILLLLFSIMMMRNQNNNKKNEIKTNQTNGRDKYIVVVVFLYEKKILSTKNKRSTRSKFSMDGILGTEKKSGHNFFSSVL